MRPEAWCFETVAVDSFMKKQKEEEHSTKPTVKMGDMLSLFGKGGGRDTHKLLKGTHINQTIQNMHTFFSKRKKKKKRRKKREKESLF